MVACQLIGSDAYMHWGHHFAPRFVDSGVGSSSIRVVGEIAKDCLSIADGEVLDGTFGELLDDAGRN